MRGAWRSENGSNDAMKDSKQSAESKPWQFKKGNSGNPGGLTEAERAARDLMRKALSDPDMVAAWKVAYTSQLVNENPIILKDFADRVGGKPKDTGEDESANGTAALVALLKALIQRPDRDRLEEELERAAR